MPLSPPGASHSAPSPRVDVLIVRCATGLEQLDPRPDPDVLRAALAHVRTWLEEPAFRTYGMQITALIENSRWDVILDSFCRVLPFGTGGRRGRVGVGPNRFNPWTLASSVEGHAIWLRARFGDGPIRVVLGLDVRAFENLRGELVADVHDPVQGLTSRDFAELAVEVYAAAGIGVWLPPAGTHLSTPELSFAVRQLEAQGGLVISASHNPPDDNGCKIYDHTGAQLVPPLDQEVAEAVGDSLSVDRMSLDRARAGGLVQELPASLHDAYVAANLRLSRFPEARSARVVFTALHGTGTRTVYEVLRQAGFVVFLEPTQATPDGSFPAVPLRAPNPENPATMEAAVAHAQEVGADLVMACDPDADRLGLMVRNQNPDPGATDPVHWRFFSGNELAVLVAHAALRKRPTDGPRPLVLKTEVTSRQLTRVAALHGARVVDHFMVGFKYIGAALAELEETGQLAGVPASLSDFAIGAEESHGVLVTTEVRDKDAAGGALLLAELASLEKARHRSLIDVLDALQARVGVVHNTLVSLVMEGAPGRQHIAAMQASLRATPPTKIGGRTVLTMADRQDPTGPGGPLRCATDAASRNVLVFELEGDARLVMRPSGTEPKAKVYVELAGQPGADPASERRRLERDAQTLAHGFLKVALKRVQINIPDWTLHCGEQLSVDARRMLVDTVLPALVQDTEAPDADVVRVVRRGLRALGPGAARLVLPGLRIWSQTTPVAHADAIVAAVASLAG